MSVRIQQAYQGEIYGIAFFSYFAAHYPNSQYQPLWHRLIEVEQLTADLLAAHLRHHELGYADNDRDMQAKGVADAHAWITLPWPELVTTLVDWVAPYEHKYRLWLTEADNDMAAYQLIAEHETAIYQCWQSQLQGLPGITYLSAFLTKYGSAKHHIAE